MPSDDFTLWLGLMVLISIVFVVGLVMLVGLSSGSHRPARQRNWSDPEPVRQAGMMASLSSLSFIGKHDDGSTMPVCGTFHASDTSSTSDASSHDGCLP